MKPNAYIDGLLKSLPESPGVYQYFNSDGEIIYVGKAKNLKRRVNSYFNKEHESYKTRALVGNIADLKYLVVKSEQDAFLLENNLIKKHQPHYNILLKDGKSYPSICITREDYPRILKTRTIARSMGDYYGPYTYAGTLELVLELIHSLYPIRTCNMAMNREGVRDGKYKVCLKYHLKNCCGVCENLVEREEYLAYIEAARKIIRGDGQEIQDMLMEKMQHLAGEMRFEEAQKVKEQYLLIEKFKSKTVISNTHVRDVDVFGYDESEQNAIVTMLHLHKGSIVQGQTVEYKKGADESREEILAHGIMELREQLGSHSKEAIVPFIPDWWGDDVSFSTPTTGDRKELLDLAMKNVAQYKQDRLKQADKLNPDQRMTRVLGALQRLLGLEEMPIWIDSFDNSHLQGSNAVGGCVVYKKAKPSKRDYKKFTIKTSEGNDDYAATREVVYRRYQHLLEEGSGLPNLILADGGIGQMHAIQEATEQMLGVRIPIAGMVKDDKHRTCTLLYGDPPKEIGMKVTDEVFKFVTQVQDEVHRFAISFHKSKRSKKQVESELDNIPNVGETTKKALLSHFKSVKRLKEAKLEDIEQVCTKSRASAVYAYFHGEISR